MLTKKDRFSLDWRGFIELTKKSLTAHCVDVLISIRFNFSVASYYFITVSIKINKIQ